MRQKYYWLVAGGWFFLREKCCWLVADKTADWNKVLTLYYISERF
jgi:hypothetical protein